MTKNKHITAILFNFAYPSYIFVIFGGQQDHQLAVHHHERLETSINHFEKYIAYVCKSDLNNNFYCFFRGHGNESRNLIGSLPGQYFPISAHGPR